MPAASPDITAKAVQMLMETGARLRKRRRELKISSVAAAEAAGLSRVTLHRIEKGASSVTVGAYVAAALAMGMRFDLGLENEGDSRPAASLEGWIPARISLARYPKLRELAWHVQGVDHLAPREALDVYERNERHLDRMSLSSDEQNLVDALREAFR